MLPQNDAAPPGRRRCVVRKYSGVFHPAIILPLDKAVILCPSGKGNTPPQKSNRSKLQKKGAFPMEEQSSKNKTSSQLRGYLVGLTVFAILIICTCFPNAALI